MHLPILYRDDQIVAIDKPAGVLVHRSNIARQESVFILQELRNQLDCHVYPAHRLDRPTSGVLLFGLDSTTAQQLAEQFAQRRVEKDYWLVCRGYAPEQGDIDYPLVPRDDFQSKRKKRGLEPRVRPAQEACTQFRRLATFELDVAVDRYPQSRYSLVEARPLTGRKHQLRRHFKHIGHPLIGDPRYGKSTHNRFFAEQLGCDRLCLHARRLRLRHPLTGVELLLEAPPSGRFLRALQQLGYYTGAFPSECPVQ